MGDSEIMDSVTLEESFKAYAEASAEAFKEDKKAGVLFLRPIRLSPVLLLRLDEDGKEILKNPYNGFSSSLGNIFALKSPGDSKGSNYGKKKEQEDDLMTRFAPILQQRLHDALEGILVPVACGLRIQGEEARKERQRLLALEKQKLTRNLKKLERLQRRRAGRFQRRHSVRRASSAFPRRRRQGQV